LLRELALNHSHFVTLEDSVVAGGAGSAVAQYLSAQGLVVHMLHLGLPDQFIDHGEVAQLLEQHGLSAQGIASSIAQFVA
jgi:1-deoxy-D-xylulose-5-phosphate synthase